ncbi:MAG: PQQ-like beta-propeller repeat protein [Planctomycetales bacterium]|nr:PQQ-like beta-propeller repeat protein [Planctomycetales bacterium]
MKLVKQILIGSITLGIVGNNLPAEDWPTFGGVGRDSVSSETNIVDSWDTDGPRLLWTAVGAGKGYASPAVANDQICTLGDHLSTTSDGQEYLVCFDAKSGKELWKTAVGPSWDEHGGRTSWNGARSTPTIDGDMVYVTTPFGKLVAANRNNGSILWTKDLKADFGGKKKDNWGYSESPLIDGALLVCTPGGSKSTVVALDKITGSTVWTCVRDGDVGAGHSSIVVSNVGGRKVYVQNTGMGPMGIDALTGELLWTYDTNPPTAFIPSPIINGDLVFTYAGYGLGGALLQQIAGPGNKVSIKEHYGLNKELGNKHGGLVLVDGYLYGGREDKNVIFCADLKTGNIAWEERGSGSGSTSVAAVDGKLVVRYQDGTVALARINADKLIESNPFKAPGSGDSNMPSWAHPVVSGGKLLLRENDSILCYDISK